VDSAKSPGKEVRYPQPSALQFAFDPAYN